MYLSHTMKWNYPCLHIITTCTYNITCYTTNRLTSCAYMSDMTFDNATNTISTSQKDMRTGK